MQSRTKTKMLDGSSTMHRGLQKNEMGTAEEPDERRNQSSLHYTLKDKVWTDNRHDMERRLSHAN